MAKKYAGIIYLIESPSCKKYVGQTVNFERRMQAHKSGDKRYKSAIHEAIVKYGFDNMKISKLEEIEASSFEELKELLNEKEILFIKEYDSYNNGYNLNEGGNQVLVEYEGDKNPFFGMEHSEETKNKMSKAKIGNSHTKGKVYKKVLCDGIEYNGANDVANNFDVSVGVVRDWIRGKSKSWKKYFKECPKYS